MDVDIEKYQKKINELGEWCHPIRFNKYLKTNSKYSINSTVYGINKWNKIIRRNLPKNLNNKSILDIGCASGLYSILCAKEGANVTSIELDKQCCQQMKLSMEIFSKIDNIEYSKRIKVINQNILEFKFEDYKKFDVIMALNVLYWLIRKIGHTEFNNLIHTIKNHCKTFLIQADENKYIYRKKNNLSTIATDSKSIVNLLKPYNFSDITVDKPINLIGLFNLVKRKVLPKSIGVEYAGVMEIDIRNPFFYSRPIVRAKTEEDA